MSSIDGGRVSPTTANTRSLTVDDPLPLPLPPITRSSSSSLLGFLGGMFTFGVLYALVRGGLSPLRAIQAATINAAELLGWAKDMGAVEPGKYADLIAVNGDPLADIGVMERVVFVMKGGEILKNNPGGSR